ncbi:MAG: magnesium transporter CorA family protein [Aquabacterium sp.]|uniref:magnesium transporter CorA family protein n=1 Tax=Aquabacterium sp. TaxID=1872578 RepID=UPI002A370B80|nr:magnesium transporter CorA family protein [Aquabacterium sp.]MDX9844137.1 magnesium transporter CorA family protein [Aquabacterium sp.]
MRFFLIHDSFTELPDWPAALPPQGFLWVTCSRRVFEVQLERAQQHLQRLAGGGLVDLHVSDLINPQLPSQYDYTSWYDLLVFRRLAAGQGTERMFLDEERGTASSASQALAAIDTSPVGFAVFDRVLLTVHPADCSVRDFFQTRLSQLGQGSHATGDNGQPPAGELSRPVHDDEEAHLGVDPQLIEEHHLAGLAHGHRTEGRGPSRLPPSPADLMLRIVNHMVDSYLDLRRLLTRQLGYLQQDMLRSSGRFRHWQALLASRNTLHMLEDICEDQRSALQEWIDALEDWPVPTDPVAAREREVLRVRSRDVQEHIERVLNHVRRLETSSESAVQMHFSLQGSRTNAIMRTLTVLTAIFLPLNLITGVFGMNFDALPLIHASHGFWLAFGLMALVVVMLVWWFRRNRYLGD